MPILDNFESQFISNATKDNNGLMSSYDKVKIDTILLDDIDYINNGLRDIENYNEEQFIYGIKIDMKNSDPNTCVTYTNDALGIIPLEVNQTTGECNYGGWKDIIENKFGIAPCLLKNTGEILAYLNPDDYTKTITGDSVDIESGSFGQVMIRFKHLYYKFTIEDDVIWFRISNKQIDNTWIDNAFAMENGIGTINDEMFIGAYESGQKNNMLQSLSNLSPSFNLEFEQIQSYSSFGVFHMINITKKQFIIFLAYLVTKSIDLENKIGNGNIESDVLLNSGTMNTKGLFYGKNTKNEGVKLFGIENLWGNQLKYMNGIIQKLVYVINKNTGLSDPEQHIYLKEFYPYDDIEDYIDSGKIDGNLSGFISSIKFLSNSIYIPDKLTGASNTYFKSYFQNDNLKNSTDRLYGIYGGNNKYSDKSGAEFLLLANLNPVDRDDYQVTTHIVY